MSDERLRAALVLADGVLAFLLVVVFVGTVLPSRPLNLPTGASSLGVVLIGVFGFACGAVLGTRTSLVERCGSRRKARLVDALLVVGTLFVASLVVLPAFDIDLSASSLVLGVVGVVLVSVAPVVAVGGEGDGDRGLLLRRGIATVADGVPAFALWYASVWMLLPSLGQPAPTGATWTEIIAVIVVLFFWGAVVRVPLEAYDGRSVGKRLAGVRVVGEDGDTPGLRAVLVRNALRPIDSLPLGYIVGLSYAARSDGIRRIGDTFAGTRVVRSGGSSERDDTSS